jgi:cyanophycinase
MQSHPKGTLIIIGGHEDKDGDRPILTYVAEQARRTNRNGRLVIVTVATEAPAEMAEQYTAIFKELGVHAIDVLDIRTRAEAHDQANVDKIAKAAVVFFTGGDQLRITSQIGDSPLFRCLHERYRKGATIVGTSAGAAAMPETMLVAGPSDTSNEVSGIGMAPGLGLIAGVVIDSHFAERGRMGRLLGAVAQNPKNLGLGIDEDTAIVVMQNQHIQVLGSGAVYVVDGQAVSYSSLSDKNPEGIVSVFDVTLHVLGADDRLDLQERRPLQAKTAKGQSPGHE